MPGSYSIEAIRIAAQAPTYTRDTNGNLHFPGLNYTVEAYDLGKGMADNIRIFPSDLKSTEHATEQFWQIIEDVTDQEGRWWDDTRDDQTLNMYEDIVQFADNDVQLRPFDELMPKEKGILHMFFSDSYMWKAEAQLDPEYIAYAFEHWRDDLSCLLIPPTEKSSEESN